MEVPEEHDAARGERPERVLRVVELAAGVESVPPRADHDWSVTQIADHLNVGGRYKTISRSTIVRVISLYEETGDVFTPRGGTRRRAGIMSDEHWATLQETLDAQPDLFIDEFQLCLYLTFGVNFPISVILQTMHRHGYTRRVLETPGSVKFLLVDDLRPRGATRVDDSGRPTEAAAHAPRAHLGLLRVKLLPLLL